MKNASIQINVPKKILMFKRHYSGGTSVKYNERDGVGVRQIGLGWVTTYHVLESGRNTPAVQEVKKKKSYYVWDSRS